MICNNSTSKSYTNPNNANAVYDFSCLPYQKPIEGPSASTSNHASLIGFAFLNTLLIGLGLVSLWLFLKYILKISFLNICYTFYILNYK